jgi:hypothetical protein
MPGRMSWRGQSRPSRQGCPRLCSGLGLAGTRKAAGEQHETERRTNILPIAQPEDGFTTSARPKQLCSGALLHHSGTHNHAHTCQPSTNQEQGSSPEGSASCTARPAWAMDKANESLAPCDSHRMLHGICETPLGALVAIEGPSLCLFTWPGRYFVKGRPSLAYGGAIRNEP